MRVTKWFSGAGLVLLALVVLFSTLFTDWVFKGTRLDLTEAKMYTLSDGSENIVSGLDQPLDLYFFFSQSTTRDALAWRNYSKQVRELLEEFEQAAKGNIKLTIIDPEPFSENEDRAAAFGLEAVPITNGGDNMYFGLVAQYGDLKEGASAEENSRSTLEIPFFQPDRQEFLEYDIAKMMHRVSQQKRPKVGLISGLEVEGGFDMMSRQPTQPWHTISQIKQSFEVATIGIDADEIPIDEYDLLMVINPKNLTNQTLFAIDQFVLNGGKAMFFVDPYAELDSMSPDKSSQDLNQLFNAWGVDVNTKQFVGDAQLALQIAGPDRQPVRHLGILQFSDSNLAQSSQIVSNLETLHFASAGFIHPLKEAATEFTPLVMSTDQSMPLDVGKLDNLQDSRTLNTDFAPTGEKYVLAAHITGQVKSAFPEGVPVSEDNSEDDHSEKGQPEEEKLKEENSEENEKEMASGNSSSKTPDPGSDSLDKEYLTESVKPIQVMIVADTDVLSDRLWVQVNQMFGQSVAQPFADNGDFFFNAVDVMAGSRDLISIRGRGRYFRPFTVVQDMQRSADARFQKVEQELMTRLEEIESELAEIQKQQGDNDEMITLTPEVETQLLDFQKEKLKIRKQLREVQHKLNKDIEQLEFRLKLVNIALIPILLTLLVLGVAFYRRRKSKA